MMFDHFLEKDMKGKHGEEEDRNDAMLRFHQQFYFHQQQQQQQQQAQAQAQRKRECLSDEVDSARSRGDQPKKPRIDIEQQTDLKTLSMGGGPDGASIEVAKRRRGRPPGSKNRPKPPAAASPEAAEPPAAAASAAAAATAIMSPHVLEIPSGHDVADSLARFARRRNLGICILSGTGAVANVVLRQPHFGGGAPPPPSASLTVGFHGRFDILSLSATFLPAAMTAVAPGISGEMSISLAGPQGQVVGGAVAGPLMAAGTVVVVAAAFSNPTFHRLPVEDDVPISVSVSGGGESDEQPQQQHPPLPPQQQVNHQRHAHQHQHASTPAVPPAESCGMSIYSGHISSDVIWGAPPTSRSLPPPPY